MVKFSTILDRLLVKNVNAKQEIAGSSVILEAKRLELKTVAPTGHRHTVPLPQTKSSPRAELDLHNSWQIIAPAFSTILDWLLVKNVNAKQEIAGSSVILEAKRLELNASAPTGHRDTVPLQQTKSYPRAELDPHNSWPIIAPASQGEAQTMILAPVYRLPVSWASATPIFQLASLCVQRWESDVRLSFFFGWSRRFQVHVHGLNCHWSSKDANARASCFTKLSDVCWVFQRILHCFL